MIDNKARLFYFNASNNYADTNAVTCVNPQDIVIDSQDSVYIACANTGNQMIRFDKSDGYQSSTLIWNASVSHEVVDYDDNLWISTANSFLFLNASNNYAVERNISTGSHSYFYGAMDMHGNLFWVNGSTMIMQNRSDNFAISSKNWSLSMLLDNPREMSIDKDGDIWIVTDPNSLWRFNHSTNYDTWVNYTTASEPRTVAIDLNNSIWVVSNANSNLYLMNANDSYNPTILSQATSQSRGGAVDKFNNFWETYNLRDYVERYEYNNSYAKTQFTVTGLSDRRLRGTAINRLIDLFLYYEVVNLSQIEVPNNPPSITLLTPADAIQTAENLSVSFEVNDTDNATLSCSLYVNSQLNQTNSSVISNSTVTFDVIWQIGQNSWYVTCSDDEDTTTSATRHIYYDPHEPQIFSGLPSILNTTVYTGYTMWFYGNVSNINLTEVTRTIYYPNSSVYYLNQNTSLTNNTFFSWNETFNTTDEPNGVWTYTIYAEDTVQNHTHYYSFTVNNCVPDWQCSGYASCGMNDTALCNNVTDNNACGLPFTENVSTYFTPQSCNYCSADLEVLGNATECDAGYQTIWTRDNNFATCCNVTGISADCPQNESVVSSLNSCSAFDYSENDIASASIDVLVKFLIAFGIFAGVTAIIFVFNWGWKKIRFK